MNRSTFADAVSARRDALTNEIDVDDDFDEDDMDDEDEHIPMQPERGGDDDNDDDGDNINSEILASRGKRGGNVVEGEEETGKERFNDEGLPIEAFNMRNERESDE